MSFSGARLALRRFTSLRPVSALLARDQFKLALFPKTPRLDLVKNLAQDASKRFNRTHYCGQLGLEHLDQHVTIYGWLQAKRFSNFLVLRDLRGTVQVVLDDEFFKKNPGFSTENLNLECVLAVSGKVSRRPQGQENAKMATGHVEVKCDKLELLNQSELKLPFYVSEFNRPNETLRLKHRYLDLRFSELQQNLITRSNFVFQVRKFLQENNFLDIETPTLFRRTPGGAREFIVPTKYPEQFYCLTQSPQQFKQLLMVGGLDRYYQIARCYRDETSKQDRQPEFTQIDIEMSFADENDVINVVERLLERAWPGQSQIRIPFERMKYADAMRFYGIDKPDLRFDMKFADVTDFVRSSSTGLKKIDSQSQADGFKAFAFKVPRKYGMEEIGWSKIENEYKSIFKATTFNKIQEAKKDSFVFMILGDERSNTAGNHIVKFMDEKARKGIFEHLDAREDAIILLASQSESKLLDIFGKMRLATANLIDDFNLTVKKDSGYKLLRDPKVKRFLWVVDFPLFTRNEETNQLESSHHPFTAPRPDHLTMLKEMKQLDDIIGLHYDLVLNGQEIAGGSIRIHDSELQRHTLKNVLKEDTRELEHLLKALEMGAPPHGGIALGLDRLVSIICETNDIRDVIAFPKAHSGRDLMSSAPSRVAQSELDYYKIKCVPE